MSTADRKFRLAFPVITLPANHGGKRAIILFSVQQKGDLSGIVYATCVDIDGQQFSQVPIRMDTIRAATLAPVYFQEVDKTDAPLIVGPGIAP